MIKKSAKTFLNLLNQTTEVITVTVTRTEDLSPITEVVVTVTTEVTMVTITTTMKWDSEAITMETIITITTITMATIMEDSDPNTIIITTTTITVTRITIIITVISPRKTKKMVEITMAPRNSASSTPRRTIENDY